MEDDIDIEEHNVLDNPRIKSIFPDLSRVKIEIVDDDDGVVEDHYEVPIENPEGLYQYEYSFDNTEENEEPLHYEEEEQEEREEQTYFFNNEIILGSKPPVDWDALKLEAETSHPIVDLEDWGPALESSPCYCSTCAILFPTVNALDAHKMISHSYLVAMDLAPRNTARKSTVTSKYCHHCSKTFPDDTSLIKHLYELLPLNFTVKEEPVDSEMVKPKKSVIPFPKKVKSATPIPKTIKIEPKEEFEQPIVEVQKRKVKFKLPRDGKFFASSSLVPRGTLFQCNKCQIGFISCFSAQQHSKNCEKAMIFDKCNVCKRKIRKKDSAVHALQHQTNDKLKIYTINKNIYDKVLCKCPKCLSCFDELGFWAHYGKCKKSEKKSTRCPDCDVHIAATRYQLHRLKHTTKKLTKKDFIVIEFLDHPAKNLPDMKLKAKEYKKKYKEKVKHTKQGADVVIYPHDIPLYYCEFCGCCQYKLSYKGHVDGICKGSKGKKYCDKCGLCFSAKSITSHNRLHAKRSFQLKDIKIFNLLTGIVIEPPIPEMYQCQKCEKHFLYHKNLKDHKCKQEKFISCKVCAKKFSVPAYRIHKKFHIVDELIPELLKKYNSIQTLWNVIYMCQACEIVNTSYDAAVTHSQGHLNYIITDFHKMCYKCNLKVAEKEFHLHQNLHVNNGNLGRDSFKFLMYNPPDLFRKEWMQLFSDLPEQDRRQILMKSAYRYTRSIRLQVESTSLTDNKKYFCMNCNTFMDGPALSSHIANNCAKNNEITCEECQVSFHSLQNLLEHDGDHEKITEKYTIISFNNECDKAFNNHLRMLESKVSYEKKKQKEVPLSKLRELLLKDVTKKGFKLYKCKSCGTCVSLKSSIPRHNCVPKSERKFCKTCEQYFSVKKFHVHMEAHRKKPNIKKSNIHVVLFAGKNQLKDDISAKVYKCKCGLHFTSMKTIESHLEVCNNSLKISNEKCSKCDLIFPTDLLVTHIINHHSKETKIAIVNVAKINYFKCYNCTVIFLDMKSLNSHTQSCDPKNGVKCSNCKLVFDKKALATHNIVCADKADKVYIKKVITVKKIVKESTVYKCEQCDLCYLTNNTYKYHANEANHKHKNPLTCKVCALKFTNCSYQKHIKLHAFSNEDYKIKVVNGVTRQFYFMTGSNKVDNDVKSPVKRKLKTARDENDSPIAKKVQKLDDTSPKLRRSRSKIDEPSTSKGNEELIIPDQTSTVPKMDESPQKSRRSRSKIDEAMSKNEELIVPDQISSHCAENNTSLTDKNDSSDVSGLSNKLKSKLLVNKYDANLYKCLICNQHYMKDSSFDYHVKNHRKSADTENYNCDICGLDFSRYTLPRHKFIHHDRMKLKLEDFIIYTESAYSTAAEIRDKITVYQAKNETVTPEISPENDNISEDSEKIIDKTADTNQNDQEMIYYKCSECNVCFVDAKMCYNHTKKHEILDPKLYIQCKICEFQFLIDSLKEHMIVHHKDDFTITKLTIQEYSPQIDSEPKIETYNAIDKVQSRLVSTTTDVGVS